MARRQSKTLLYKYMMSYAVILLLPVLMIGVFLYPYLISLLQEEVTKSNLNRLSAMKEQVDVKMSELQNIAFHVAANSKLSPYQATKNSYSEMETIAQLRNYVSANTFISNFLLYYYGRTKLYSPYSTYDTATFTERIFSFEQWPPERFFSDINEVQYPYVRGAEYVRTDTGQRARYMTYMIPVGINQSDPYGTLVFFIHEQRFKELLNQKIEDSRGNTLILSKDGALIASARDVGSQEMELLDKLKGMDGETVTLQLGESDYYVFREVSEKSGWIFLSVVDTKIVLQKVEQAKIRTLYGLLLLMLLGITIIFIASHLNYRPISMLRRAADKLVTPLGTQQGEFESIRTALYRMSESNEELNRRIETSRPALRHYLLLNLLKGTYKSHAEWQASGELAELSLNKSYYTVLTVLLPNSGGSRTLDSWPADWKTVFPAHTELIGLEGLEQDQFVLLLGTDHMIDADDEHLLSISHKGLCQLLDEELTIGVGRTYSQVNELGKSYIEACGASDYRLLKGKGTIIFFHDAVPQHETARIHYSKKEWNQLKNYIYQNDGTAIERHLDEMMERIRQERMPLFMVKCICYDLINVILGIIAEMAWDDALLGKRYPDLVSLSEFETVEELVRLVKEISTDIQNIISSRKESGNLEPLERMRQYIDREYASSQFSLQALAEDLGMSPSYLSRYFKEQTGETVSLHVNRLRMNKAKKLLRSGDGNLQDIVAEIGYGSVSGFIRKFKELEGITPGEFRSMVGKMM